MNQFKLDPNLSADQPENVTFDGNALTTSEPEILVLDQSILALIGGGDGAPIW